jgi:hypothetical protein
LDLLGIIGHDLGYPELVQHSTEMDIGEGASVRVLDLETLRSPRNPKVYSDPFSPHPVFIGLGPHNPWLIYRRGVHVLCQRRTEPAK